jgi:hypothetical protein
VLAVFQSFPSIRRGEGFSSLVYSGILIIFFIEGSFRVPKAALKILEGDDFKRVILKSR